MLVADTNPAPRRPHDPLEFSAIDEAPKHDELGVPRRELVDRHDDHASGVPRWTTLHRHLLPLQLSSQPRHHHHPPLALQQTS